MRCARRLAGARKPAPSTGSASRPDPRPGRRRARLLGLLPALALLLCGALSPFAVGIAWAQVASPPAPTITVTATWHNGAPTLTIRHSAIPSDFVFFTQIRPATATTWPTPGHQDTAPSGVTFSNALSDTTARVLVFTGFSKGTAYDVRAHFDHPTEDAISPSSSPVEVTTLSTQFQVSLSTEQNDLIGIRTTIKEGEQVALKATIEPGLTAERARAHGIVLPIEIPLALDRETSESGDFRLPGTIVVGPRTGNLVHVYAAHDADTDDEHFKVRLGALPSGFAARISEMWFAITDDDEPPQQTYRLPPVTNVNAVAAPFGSGSLNMSWTVPTGAGSSDITHFRLRWREQGTSDWGDPFDTRTGLSIFNPFPASAGGLRSGRPYDVEVASIRKEGDELLAISGWASATGTPVTHPYTQNGVSTAIGLNLQVTPGDRQLRLRWTRTPALQGGARPGYYNVQYRERQRRVLDMITDGDEKRPRYVGNAPVYVCTDRPNNVEGWIDHGSTPDGGDTTRVINGLTPGVEYEVRVQHSSQTRNWFYATGTPSGSGGVLCRPTVSVSLSVSPNPVDEGEAVTVTATLSQALPWDVTIPLKLSAHRVTGNRGRPNNGLFIPAGSTSASGRIWTPRDSDELDNTFTVAVHSTHASMPDEVTEVVSPSSFTVTITDSSVSDATRLKALGITIPQ